MSEYYVEIYLLHCMVWYYDVIQHIYNIIIIVSSIVLELLIYAQIIRLMESRCGKEQ